MHIIRNLHVCRHLYGTIAIEKVSQEITLPLYAKIVKWMQCFAIIIYDELSITICVCSVVIAAIEEGYKQQTC